MGEVYNPTYLVKDRLERACRWLIWLLHKESSSVAAGPIPYKQEYEDIEGCFDASVGLYLQNLDPFYISLGRAAMLLLVIGTEAYKVVPK
jgi:hypothetical protein